MKKRWKELISYQEETSGPGPELDAYWYFDPWYHISWRLYKLTLTTLNTEYVHWNLKDWHRNCLGR